MKTKEFRLQDNRLLFICPHCGKRTIYSVFSVQRNTYKCERCSKLTRSVFRRNAVALKTHKGQKIQVTLQEISPSGDVFQVLNDKDSQYIKIGEEVKFICSWDIDSATKTRCIVQSNDSGWVGLRKIDS